MKRDLSSGKPDHRHEMESHTATVGVPMILAIEAIVE